MNIRKCALSACTALLLAALTLPLTSHAPLTKTTMNTQKNYYCQYCGHKFPDVRQLTSASCPRHPNGANRGRHSLYEGSEKSQYLCKYCGRKFPSILVMTGGTCANHPNGPHKGQHAPAL